MSCTDMIKYFGVLILIESKRKYKTVEKKQKQKVLKIAIIVHPIICIKCWKNLNLF